MRKHIRVYKGIEREVRVFNLSMDEVMLIGIAFMVVIVISVILNSAADVKELWTILCSIPFLVGLVFLLRIANKQNHPKMISSWLMFRTTLPKNIHCEKQPHFFDLEELKKNN